MTTADRTLQNMRRRLETWELKHLRLLAAELAERLERAEEKAAAAAEEAATAWQSADFWQQHAHELTEELYDAGGEVCLTQSGELIVTPAATTSEQPQPTEDHPMTINQPTYITVPETTLPNGTVVPAFRVAKYLSSRSADDTPWVEINYQEARDACQHADAALITETQWLAIAHQIASQPENWTGGAVGEGSLYMGLHLGTVDEAQGPAYESPEAIERRWHVLGNGERIADFAGNAYSWVFDDVQGDEQGLIAKPFAENSPSIAVPYPSTEKGVGWYPRAGADWSGGALLRGGCWDSDVRAGVFRLVSGWPEGRGDNVGFRCTTPIGL